jgi:hypothetical protein
LNRPQIERIRGILEELKASIPAARTVFCLNLSSSLIIDEIGLDGLGRDAAGELVSLVVTMLTAAKKLSFEIIEDPWTCATFIGSQSYLLIGMIGEIAILGVLVESSEGTIADLSTAQLEMFLDYRKELAELLRLLSTG